MSTALVSLTNQLATSLGIESSAGELLPVLKATAFKGQVSDAQMTALMVVANQYGLNPWTREIYAFPDSNNGIVPVVGVDGWSRIINTHAQFDGMDFEQDAESCTCIIHRKDRAHPIKVTEYLEECRRDTKPWRSHPRRMLRHKAMIQGARIAFGYVGIFDQDEAEVMVEKDITPNRKNGAEVAQAALSVEGDPEARMKLIADLEAVATADGRQAFRDAWKRLTQDQMALVGIPERDRIDHACANPVIEGSAEVVE